MSHLFRFSLLIALNIGMMATTSTSATLLNATMPVMLTCTWAAPVVL